MKPPAARADPAAAAATALVLLAEIRGMVLLLTVSANDGYDHGMLGAAVGVMLCAGNSWRRGSPSSQSSSRF